LLVQLAASCPELLAAAASRLRRADPHSLDNSRPLPAGKAVDRGADGWNVAPAGLCDFFTEPCSRPWRTWRHDFAALRLGRRAAGVSQRVRSEAALRCGSFDSVARRGERVRVRRGLPNTRGFRPLGWQAGGCDLSYRHSGLAAGSEARVPLASPTPCLLRNRRWQSQWHPSASNRKGHELWMNSRPNRRQDRPNRRVAACRSFRP